MSLPSEIRDTGRNLERLRNLSDGVFAIVLTLLALNLNLPNLPGDPSHERLMRQILKIMPIVTGYIMSFIVVGLYWIVHLRMYRHILRYDRYLLWLNLGMLFFVSLLPFSTEVLADNDKVPTAWALYALNVALVGISSTSVWSHAVTKKQVDERVSLELRKFLFSRGLVVPIVFAASIPVAYFHYGLATLMPILVVIASRVLRAYYGHLPDELNLPEGTYPDSEPT